MLKQLIENVECIVFHEDTKVSESILPRINDRIVDNKSDVIRWLNLFDSKLIKMLSENC